MVPARLANQIIMALLLTALGAIISTALGLVGTLTETRKDGRLTKWGKWATSGILLAGTVGFGSQLYDYLSKRDEEQKTLARIEADTKRGNELLLEVRRASSRFGSVSVDARITFPTTDAVFRYKSMLVDHSISATKPTTGSTLPGAATKAIRRNDIEVSEDEADFPSRDRDGPLGYVASSLTFEVSLYRAERSIRPESFSPNTSWGRLFGRIRG